MRADRVADVADGVMKFTQALANSHHAPLRDVLVCLAELATKEVNRLDSLDTSRNR